ncbi:hypothetical protein MTO96_012500 [Rhipicephalus appendiculatus]
MPHHTSAEEGISPSPGWRHHDKPFQPASPIAFALGAHAGTDIQGRHYPPPREPGAQHLTAPHTWDRQIPRQANTTKEPHRTGQSPLQQNHEYEQAASSHLVAARSFPEPSATSRTGS